MKKFLLISSLFFSSLSFAGEFNINNNVYGGAEESKQIIGGWYVIFLDNGTTASTVNDKLSGLLTQIEQNKVKSAEIYYDGSVEEMKVVNEILIAIQSKSNLAVSVKKQEGSVSINQVILTIDLK